MKTYEIKIFRMAWTRKGLVKKVELFLNEVHKIGKQEVVSVSISGGEAYVTLKKI